MPDEKTETTPEIPNTNPGTQQGAPAGAPASQQQQAKTVVIPTAQIGKMKKEEREKGRREAEATLAKQYGFASVEEFRAAAGAFKAGGGGQQRPQGQGGGGNQPPKQQGKQPQRDPGPAPEHLSRKAAAAWERERATIVRENEQLKKKVNVEGKKNRGLQKRLDDLQTEMALRESAILAGIKDPDYAVRLCLRTAEGLDEEKQASFDEGKFFSGLRDSHPYLFGEIVKPATTGTAGNGNAPPTPKPEEAAAAAGKNGQVDAKKLSQQDFQALLAKRGLNTSAV